MKSILWSMAAVSALAIAAPAAAQYPNGGYQAQNGYYNAANGNLDVRIERLQTRIQAGVQSGAITRQEAIPLREQLRQLKQLNRYYAGNGLSGQERADLQQRIRNLRQQIRYADGGRGPANVQYDEDEEGYYPQGQYGQSGQYERVDRNNDGYDDRDHDRDGRWDDDRGYGQNGQYDRVDRNDDGYDDRDYDRDDRWDDDQEDRGYQQPAQGGLGGFIQSIFGGGSLQVGQRAPGNLYGVPSEYRDRFRDSYDIYYRSDGRQIYEIDARTQTVVRVYGMNR